MVVIGSKDISIQTFKRILYKKEKLTLEKGCIDQIKANNEFLKAFSEGKVIYGLNTGFGPMAKTKIAPSDQIQLQYNLIRSHAAGAGKTISEEHVRSTMICRLVSLAKGKSGIPPDPLKLLSEFINRAVYPVIPEHGGVGASGDLVQLSHLALALIGEGQVQFDNKMQDTKTVLAKLNLHPVKIKSREGLAMINGTSCMTGIGLANVIKAKNIFQWALQSSTMLNEIMNAYDDYFSKELNQVKKHQGQQIVAQQIRANLKGSQLIRSRSESYHQTIDQLETDHIQEVYSLRCLPQILGPIYDTIENTESILIRELNSVSDNPIIDEKNNNVFHGGNFHGDYVALEMDKLRMVMTKLSMLIERQINFLFNPKLNEKLPPFLNLGVPGLNLGMQGMQFTATSTTAENQTLSAPIYTHSIPSNNDNQDIVSMGANAALLTGKVIDNTYEILSIKLIAILQAIDYLKIQDQLSEKSKAVYGQLRAKVPVFVDDASRYEAIKIICECIQKTN
jgi:histidine ammonia-lyase